MKTGIRLAAAIYLGCIAPAFAAGYGLREFSAGAMGAAYAGAAATGSDASYLAYNPASLASVVETDFSLDATAILPSSSAAYSSALTSAGTPVSGASGAHGFITNAIVPELAFRTRLSDRWSAGLVVDAPWGLATNYPADSVARYYALQTKLMTANITPSVSYEISSQIAVAAGIQIQYAKGTLSSAVDIGTLGALLAIPGSAPGAQDGTAHFTASSWGTGFVIGVMAHPVENITAGFSYHSSVLHHLNGPITYTLDTAGLGGSINAATGLLTNTQGSASLTTPDSINSGLRVEITPQIATLFELDWTNWEKFHQLQLVAANPAQPTDVTSANWRSTWFGAAGVEYRPEGQWSFKTGIAYDQSPVPDSTLNPRIPDADRITVAAGATYHLDNAADIEFAYEHLFISDRNIALSAAQSGNALRGSLTGTTQSSVDAFGLQFVYRLDAGIF